MAYNRSGDGTEDGTQPGTDFYDNKGGKTFTVGDPMVTGIDHEIKLDKVGNCGDENNQFNDEEGALAISKGDISSKSAGFEIENYKADRKNLLRYANDLNTSSTRGVQQQEEGLTIIEGFAAYPILLSQEGLWLEFPVMEQQNANAYIYDLNGTKVAEKEFNIKTEGSRHLWKLNHNSWPVGIYLLILQGPENLEKFKLIK